MNFQLGSLDWQLQLLQPTSTCHSGTPLLSLSLLLSLSHVRIHKCTHTHTHTNTHTHPHTHPPPLQKTVLTAGSKEDDVAMTRHIFDDSHFLQQAVSLVEDGLIELVHHCFVHQQF